MKKNKKIELYDILTIMILCTTLFYFIFVMGSIVISINDKELRNNLLASCNKSCNNNYTFQFYDKCNYFCQCLSDLRFAFLAENFGDSCNI